MYDYALVLNAGSSSLKFSVFHSDDPPRLLLHGQLEGLLTQPRFIARNDTAVVGEKEWPSGTQLGHHGAIESVSPCRHARRDGQQRRCGARPLRQLARAHGRRRSAV